ncbi:MAG: branched-chain amino acid ABC transporter permease [Erysipelotrichaceae bacterium]|nr:branched-chain amino acid ABC transporter permease [Erysipelotrichaceae bacterium]
MEKKRNAVAEKLLANRNTVLTIFLLGIMLLVVGNLKPWFGSYWVRVFNICCIYSMVTMSMNLVNGCTGIFTMGSPGFMCIGAYTTAILTMTPEIKDAVYYLSPIAPWLREVQTSFPVALLLGGVFAAIAAFIIGFPVLRLSGDYLSIATMAFSEIARVIMLNAQSITNGPIGITKIKNHVTVWVAFMSLAAVYVLLRMLMRSTYGRALKAVRDDPVAAEAIGIPLFKTKMTSFIISGFIAGIAGGLLASLVGTIDANQFVYSYVNQFLLMMILGGNGSMTGSILGSFVITIALEVFRFMDEPIDFGFWKYPGIGGMRMVLFSISLMLIVLFWEHGIMGSNEFSWNRIIEKLKNIPASLRRLFNRKEEQS